MYCKTLVVLGVGNIIFKGFCYESKWRQGKREKCFRMWICTYRQDLESLNGKERKLCGNNKENWEGWKIPDAWSPWGPLEQQIRNIGLVNTPHLYEGNQQEHKL